MLSVDRGQMPVFLIDGFLLVKQLINIVIIVF